MFWLSASCSFKPLVAPAVPKVKDGTWTKNAIDHFVLAELEAHNLQPVAAADKRTLIRRAMFDLFGDIP